MLDLLLVSEIFNSTYKIQHLHEHFTGRRACGAFHDF